MMFLVTIPITTVLTTIAMLLPYWWSSETFQVGLWRAHSLPSVWTTVEPQIDTQEGRLLFILQHLSLVSALLTDLSCLIWFITLIRRTYHTSLHSLLTQLCLTILTYFCLSTMIFFVWTTTKYTFNTIHLSYSFYLTLFILLLHTVTLISLTLNLAQYRAHHHSIQPFQINSKVSMAFNDPLV
ncbi:unnamed protein product [Adineta ricciae]|uniref:Uncharacterized protein n=2 Tax=Adineta ricciae TaxID=249248 RepID=A0A815X377_ADIRI|nr:unnamed protein product [Adineta ricciae]